MEIHVKYLIYVYFIVFYRRIYSKSVTKTLVTILEPDYYSYNSFQLTILKYF